MPKRPTLAVDFDGVIHEYSDGWNGGALGAIMPGARDGLRQLSARYRIVVLTARHDLDAVEQWLRYHGVASFVAEVTNRKPAAVAYIDDRGFHHDDWEHTLAAFL